ncbi:TrbG/VirB9 family P-type conjugative transfer protein [Candidatus Deianiraea vastatrix]|uniref:Type IV secretion system protein VirB9 n=1 Tax=Candidatus Deianiraea vastatrix TaxID=2163644 RepID=A0A5B8XD01_9RICK|nr:TrbG/VirB9 family P-type conjugative transfer protein [Candidatus Deianiraea vastatrix]QED23120.1 Type IV secretion system protein VirB9 precursor [Candidatus Deianiraea vastatrix]
MLRYLFFILFSLYIINAKAASTETNLPIPIDNRMRTLIYSPNEVFRLKFKVGYQSHIVFPKDESPVLQSFGDSRGWSIKMVGNSMFIKPMDPGLQTNMIIETNKDRVYYFEILSTFNEDSADDDFAYRINFYYPDLLVDVPVISKNKGTINGNLAMMNSTKRQGIETMGINFRYSFAGVGKDIRPLKVFDDGHTTYMLFADNNARIPMIYSVSKAGKEDLLQYRIQDGYVAIDTTEYQFSLRLGNQLVCIFNDKYISPISIKKQDKVEVVSKSAAK